MTKPRKKKEEQQLFLGGVGRSLRSSFWPRRLRGCAPPTICSIATHPFTLQPSPSIRPQPPPRPRLRTRPVVARRIAPMMGSEGFKSHNGTPHFTAKRTRVLLLLLLLLRTIPPTPLTTKREQRRYRSHRLQTRLCTVRGPRRRFTSSSLAIAFSSSPPRPSRVRASATLLLNLLFLLPSPTESATTIRLFFVTTFQTLGAKRLPPRQFHRLLSVGFRRETLRLRRTPTAPSHWVAACASSTLPKTPWNAPRCTLGCCRAYASPRPHADSQQQPH